MKKCFKYLVIVTFIAMIGVNSMKMNSSTKPNIYLGTLLALPMANAEIIDEYTDRFLMHVTTSVEAHVKVDASGIIIKALGMAFEGSVKVNKTVEYDCCHTGGGRCAKSNPQCEDVSAIGLLVGMKLQKLTLKANIH